MNRVASRLAAALGAGAIAIAINTALLMAADALGLRTAHGGLLRLLQIAGARVASPLGLAGWWRAVLVPATSGAAFQAGFHAFVGLVMALVYAAAFEQVLPGRPWVRGVTYAALAWVLNAAVVLPLIGEGFAGSRNLTLVGMIDFAVAHTVFFVLLALLYAVFSRPARLPRPRPGVIAQ